MALVWLFKVGSARASKHRGIDTSMVTKWAETKRAKTAAPKAAKAPVTAQSSLAELGVEAAKKERVRAAVARMYGMTGEVLLEQMANPLLHRWTLEDLEKRHQRAAENERQMEAELGAQITEVRK